MNKLPLHISIWGELADVDFELRHVDVGGMRTRVLRAGAGPDLVLLHGTGGHLESYAREIAGLAADFRVTAYDMIGHGWSDLPDTPYTIDLLSDHLLGLMDALEIDVAHLSGESLGSWVAAWTAAHHPDRVARLVLNTPGNITDKPEVMAWMRKGAKAAVRDPSGENVRQRVEVLFHHKEMVTDELVNLRRAIHRRPGFLRPCRTPRCARPSPGSRPGSARSPHPLSCCGPSTTRPAGWTMPRCSWNGCPTPACT
jgi:2-hydroxy-6-oxonona-2,4-dienedioate hydrolase